MITFTCLEALFNWRLKNKNSIVWYSLHCLNGTKQHGEMMMKNGSMMRFVVHGFHE